MKNTKLMLWLAAIVLMMSLSVIIGTGQAFASDTWDGASADAYAGGSGSAGDPYQIENVAQLVYLAQQVNNGNSYNGEYFKLMDNLDLENKLWTPIGYFMGTGFGDGTYIAQGFQGTFDGDNHTISNLKIATVTQNGGTGLRHPAGLFGMTKSGCRIMNLKLVNVDVSTTAANNNYLGALVGEGCSTIINCSVVSNSAITEDKGLIPASFPVNTNIAPVLDNSGNPVLTEIDEDDKSNNGTLVSDIIGSSISDEDSNALEGIAITNIDNTNGNWECYVDNAWWSIAPVSETSALLLESDVRVRFVPGRDWNGTATITYRAWDRTTGANRTKVDVSNNGGCTAFSLDSETAAITVNPVNDVPVITDSSGGQVLDFDGADDFVELSNDTNMNTSFTFETWVRAEAANTWSRLFDFGNGSPSYNIWAGFNFNTGKIMLEVFKYPGNSYGKRKLITTNEELPLNKWIHVAVVYDENNKRGYIYWDGVLKAADVMDLSAEPDIVRTNNYIAKSNWDQDEYFKGYMRDIRIWNTAQSQLQIQNNMNRRLNGNEAGLVLYYPVAEGSGVVLHDLTGNNDGNIHSATWLQTSGINANMSISEDTVGTMAFKVTDVDNSELILSATSDNTTLIPNENLTFEGTGENRSLVVEPLENQNGSAVITINVSDGQETAAASFKVMVNAVNDQPVFTRGADITAGVDAGAQSVNQWVTGISAGPGENHQNLTFHTRNNREELFSVQPAIGHDGTLTFTPAPDKTGTALVTVYLQDDGGTANGGRDCSESQQFNITITLPTTYTLTYTAGEHGSITGATSQTVSHGESGTAVTATPTAGYHFVKWSDDVITATRTDSNVTGNINVTAAFAINEYTLTYNAGEHGSISGKTVQTVNHGMDGSEVEAIADTGYYFKCWSDGFTFAKRKDLNITGDLCVTAAFDTAETAINNDFESLKIIYAEGDSETHVTRALYLPVKGASGNTSITWISSHPSTGGGAGIGNTGRVTRPDPDGFDIDVTLTAAITENMTGVQRTKKFAVKLIKMSDEDAARDAARDLTVVKAFTFAPGDTWECVTEQFILLDQGLYNTNINWTSNKPDIIQSSSRNEKTIGIVTRPQFTDANVILTAEISRGSAKITKTFLLIVKNQTITKDNNDVRKITSRDADVRAGQQGQGDTENIDILRTELNNGTKIDTVILDKTKLQNLTDNINPEAPDNLRTVTVEITQPETEKADELAVEIPAASLSAMADKNASLQIKTDEGSVSIEHEELQDVAETGTDLFFRIVPVKNQEEQTEVKNNMAANFTVVQAADGAPINPLSIPRRIETNYSGSNAKVVLPLTGIDIPADNRQEFLDSMRIFIEHSDGSTELLTGIFLYQNGQPIEIEFTIAKFSRFQILSFYEAPHGSSRSSNSSQTIQTNDTSVIILVNDKPEKAGTAATGTEDGYIVTTISVDQEKLEQKLEKEGNNAVVTIPFENQSDIVIGELNGQMVKYMENRQAVLKIKTENAVYTLPAQQINIDDVSKKIGKNIDLKDIKVKISISKPKAETLKTVQNAAPKGEFTIVVPALNFTVKCCREDKTAEIVTYSHYIERMLAIPEGTNVNKITTGVVVETDGSVRHVPTRVVQINGKYFAGINSLTDSTYTVIWHPVEFKDCEKHWAEEEINDMGSRMVINGVGRDIFEPDSDITRAEFAAIIVRALGLKPGSGTTPFTDVKSSDWYNGFIKTAYEYEIIFGYSSDRFGPMDKITREQAITMASRAMNITGLKVQFATGEAQQLMAGFEDEDKCTNYAKNSIAACVKTGIISGRDSNHIVPGENITRGEAAVIVRRLLQKSDLI